MINVETREKIIQNYINSVKQNTQLNIIVDIDNKSINSTWNYDIYDRHDFDNISQEEKIKISNQVAIKQMKILLDDTKAKKLTKKEIN